MVNRDDQNALPGIPDAKQLFEQYLDGQRMFARIRLGDEKYEGMQKLGDFTAHLSDQVPTIRSWALAEIVARAFLQGSPLDEYITILENEPKSFQQSFLIRYLARFYIGTSHPGMCHLLARIVVDETAPQDERSWAYFSLFRVGGITPSDPLLFVTRDGDDLLSHVDWDAVRRWLRPVQKC